VNEERGLRPRSIGLHFRRFATFARRTAGLARQVVIGTLRLRGELRVLRADEPWG